VLVPLAVFMIIIAPEAVALVLGDKWKDLVRPLQIMLLQVPLRASVRMGDITGTAVGKVYTIGFFKIAYAAMIGLAALAGVRWGLAGVTWAVTAAVLLNLVMMVRFTMTYVRVSVPDYGRTWLPGLGLGTIVAAVALPCAWIMRRSAGPGILTFAAIVLVTGLALGLAVWLRPRTMGRAALQVVMDFGRRFPVLSRISLGLEKRSLERTGP
jgi:PST family polysaccharide transporter